MTNIASRIVDIPFLTALTPNVVGRADFKGEAFVGQEYKKQYRKRYGTAMFPGEHSAK